MFHARTGTAPWRAPLSFSLFLPPGPYALVLNFLFIYSPVSKISAVMLLEEGRVTGKFLFIGSHHGGQLNSREKLCL
jgi:hypothetical protein